MVCDSGAYKASGWRGNGLGDTVCKVVRAREKMGETVEGTVGAEDGRGGVRHSGGRASLSDKQSVTDRRAISSD